MTTKERGSSWVIAIALALGGSLLLACRPQEASFELKPGDLLFQDLDLGPLCDAIERVTEGYRGARFPQDRDSLRIWHPDRVVATRSRADPCAARLDSARARIYNQMKQQLTPWLPLGVVWQHHVVVPPGGSVDAAA